MRLRAAHRGQGVSLQLVAAAPPASSTTMRSRVNRRPSLSNHLLPRRSRALSAFKRHSSYLQLLQMATPSSRITNITYNQALPIQNPHKVAYLSTCIASARRIADPIKESLLLGNKRGFLQTHPACTHASKSMRRIRLEPLQGIRPAGPVPPLNSLLYSRALGG